MSIKESPTKNETISQLLIEAQNKIMNQNAVSVRRESRPKLSEEIANRITLLKNFGIILC